MDDSFFIGRRILCGLNLADKISVQRGEKAVRTMYRTHNMKISYVEKLLIIVQVLSHTR